jgi:hypothetical protein
MTEFYMDEDMNVVKAPATVEDLCAWANHYDLKYFDGLAAKAEPGMHFAITEDRGVTACFLPEKRTAYVRRAIIGSEKLCRIAVLHELVHIKLFVTTSDPDKNHGPTFKAEIKRLFESGAYENLL